MKSSLEFLKKQVRRGMMPHAYLFSGTDEDAKEEALKYILENILGEEYKTSPDFYEVASNPITVDDIRVIKSKASQTPLRDKKNMFLIRNIENLSRDGAPALLKLLEEPPAQCLILATTKHKEVILATIRSRFSQLRFFADLKITNFSEIKSIKKLSLKDQPGAVEKILKEESASVFLAEALGYVSALARKEKDRASLNRFERLLNIYSAMENPTINKRLLSEYLTMIL